MHVTSKFYGNYKPITSFFYNNLLKLAENNLLQLHRKNIKKKYQIHMTTPLSVFFALYTKNHAVRVFYLLNKNS